MPHVIIEHTESVSGRMHKANVLAEVHRAMVNTGIYAPEAIKSRTLVHNETCWGAQAMPVEFVHVEVRILAGRTIEQRQETARAVFAVLQQHFPESVRQSVNIHEMVKETYIKN